MDNRGPDARPHNDVRSDIRAAYSHSSSASALDEMERSRLEMRRIDSLRIPVGTNLADAERWMIFATLQKCGGNKTRAAALLGVSLKTLYNRLNAYRAQGLAMDYSDDDADEREDQRANGADGGASSRSRSLEDNLSETR